MNRRFEIPVVGQPSAVSFPPVTRQVLPNGMRLWALQQSAAPIVTMSCLVEAGTSVDPADRHGLASMTAGLVTEGAGRYDAIELADELARIGGQLATEAGTDMTTVTVATLAKHFERGLSLLADVVRRPRLEPNDFDRVRDLRYSRLRQVGRMPGTAADRALLSAVYGNHPYGHGALGTTVSVGRMSLDEVRTCWERGWRPTTSALLIAGDVPIERAMSASAQAFGDWTADHLAAPALAAPVPLAAGEVRVVNWPGAAQSEIRVGHLGPARSTPDYHALIAMNAILGGQFTSRINRNLRERRGITYGARTAFEMRRAGGLFACDTSVQSDATATALSEVLREMREIAVDDAVGADELAQARASLTRGYVRHFETASQLSRAMAELAAFGLPDDTFDRFVPEIERLTALDITLAARASLHPDEAALIVTGDLEKIGKSLEELGRPIAEVRVEF